MSTFLQLKHAHKIRSKDDLTQYFRQFAKPDPERLVGIECELLAVDCETGEALSYSGSTGIENILREVAYQFGYEKILEDGRIIALKKEGNLISLEPGGQVELSAGPVKNIHQVKGQLDQFFFELKTVAQFAGNTAFLAYGIQPFSRAQDIEWVPKHRYKIMASYLKKRGRLAWDMMKRTAANQVSFDYSSEQDAFEKSCLVMKLTSVASALFAHSSFSKGHSNGFATERMHIWRYTDPERCGLLIDALCPSASFDAYLDYMLGLPMMFIVRGNRWISTPKTLTFRRFMEKGFRSVKPTLEDFELHLSVAFPHVRFKQYLEIRGADGQRAHLIPAVAAFWKGILYSDEARHSAQNIVKRWAEKDYLKLERDIETKGLKAKIKGKAVLDIARELVKLSEKGLQMQAQLNEKGEDERIYLQPLKDEVLKPGVTQAERLVKLWNTSFQREKRALIQYLKI